MKKFLLSTCALMALATPALAQEENGVKLGIGGYFKGYGVYASQDEAAGSDTRSFDMVRDLELHFTGEMTLDNGLTVGADVGAAADQGNSFDVTDSFVYFSGGWGRLNVGATDGAAYLLQVQAPAVDPNYDGMDQYYSPFNYAVSGVTELAAIEFDYDQDVSAVDGAAASSDKLTYMTPVFGGFQLGVSYTPETNTSSRDISGVSADGDEDAFENVWDLAARFEQETGFGSYRIGAGYSHGSNEDGTAPAAGSPSDDRKAYNVALDLDIGSWGVGAVYTFDDRGRLDSADSDQRQVIVGLDYTTGPFVLGVSYLNQKNDFGADEIDTDRFSGGVTYNFGPGMDFRGIVTHVDHQVDAALGDDMAGTGVMLGTSITF